MFNSKEFYKEENEKTLVSYKNTLLVIKDIYEETKGCTKCRGKVQYAKFFNHTAKWILKMAELEQDIDENYFENKSFEQLKEKNYELYKELLAGNYSTSYANPAYSIEIFGDEIGQLLSVLYIKYREYILYAYKHKIFKMEECNILFIEMFNEIKNSEPNYEALRNIMSKWQKEVAEREARVYFKEIFNAKNQDNSDIINSAELSDLRYLFKFGQYITENEIKTAKVLLSYPEERINTLAKAIVLAYKNEFIKDNKDIAIKSTVRIIINVGQERIVRELLKEFNYINLQGIVDLVSSDINKQYDYDHRFDNAVYIDEEFELLKESAYENAAEYNQDMLKKYSGVVIFEKFGEKPFAPENKSQCLKLSEVQNKLMQKYNNLQIKVIDKYTPETERSFCIIAFPSPEIGEKFQEIFEDTLVDNMFTLLEK